jgi:uncharacterized membrane protein
MNINSVEQPLLKYHILHFVIGAIVAAVLLAIPRSLTVLICVLALAMLLPSALLPKPEFTNKWFDRGATLLGAVGVALIFMLLHKL